MDNYIHKYTTFYKSNKLIAKIQVVYIKKVKLDK